MSDPLEDAKYLGCSQHAVIDEVVDIVPCHTEKAAESNDHHDRHKKSYGKHQSSRHHLYLLFLIYIPFPGSLQFAAGDSVINIREECRPPFLSLSYVV